MEKTKRKVGLIDTKPTLKRPSPQICSRLLLSLRQDSVCFQNVVGRGVPQAEVHRSAGCQEPVIAWVECHPGDRETAILSRFFHLYGFFMFGKTNTGGSWQNTSLRRKSVTLKGASCQIYKVGHTTALGVSNTPHV